jgi:hypothetical protein
MAFNMKRPIIKGSVLHKASVAKAKAETRESIVSQRSTSADAGLVNAARALGESYRPSEIDYTLDPMKIDLKKKEKAEKEKTMPTEKMPTNFERNVDLQEDIALPGDTPDYNYSGRIADDQEALTLAPKNFKLKPINIDSQDLRVKKATRNLSDPKVNIGKEEMEAIKKAEEDRRRANDPLLSEINDRKELKKAGPDNIDPLTREILDQSDRPKPDYTPEYRKTVKANKVDSINAQLLPSSSDPKLKKADMPSQNQTKYAHENPKYAIKKDIEGKRLNLNNDNGYKLYTEGGETFITYNGVPITENEVPNDIMIGALQDQKEQQQNIDLNSNTPSQSPIEKRDDKIWKGAIKGGKVHQGMRKSGYIPPEER